MNRTHAMIRPVVVLSRCLAGRRCRYDGRPIRARFVTAMARRVTFKTVCPEMAIGLGVPRDPICLVDDGRGGARLLQPSTGRRLTGKMRAFAERFLRSLGAVDGFIFKGRSPTCGLRDSKILSAPGGKVVRRGRGIFAAAALERFPDAAVEDESRLADRAVRQRFLAKLSAKARLRAASRGKAPR